MFDIVTLCSGGEFVSDVNTVFITREVADKLGITPTYLIKLAKKIELSRENRK